MDELASHYGQLPKAIYVENMRDDDIQSKGKRVPDRLKMLGELYDEAKIDAEAECRIYLNECLKNKVRLTDSIFTFYSKENASTQGKSWILISSSSIRSTIFFQCHI